MCVYIRVVISYCMPVLMLLVYMNIQRETWPSYSHTMCNIGCPASLMKGSRDEYTFYPLHPVSPDLLVRTYSLLSTVQSVYVRAVVDGY